MRAPSGRGTSTGAQAAPSARGTSSIGLGDRQDDRDARLALVRRAARVASERQEPEKAARVWEKVLAIEPTDAIAARALVPTYQKSDKPAKLLPVYEVLLAHCHTRDERLARAAAPYVEVMRAS